MSINPYQAPNSNVAPATSVPELVDFVPGGRRCDAGDGWQWLMDGFALFRKAPLIWIAMLIIWMLIAGALTLIPMATNLATPLATAGFMLGCRALDRGEELEIGHLFAGFQCNIMQLLLTALFTLAGVIVAMIPLGILAVVVFGAAMAMGLNNHAPELLVFVGIFVGAILFIGLLTPVIMALYFAVPLVIFHNLTAIDAMKDSFRACWRNIWPLTVYSVVIIGLAIASVFTLFFGLIVLLPTLICAHYVSYKAIFTVPSRQEPGFGPKVSLSKDFK